MGGQNRQVRQRQEDVVVVGRARATRAEGEAFMTLDLREAPLVGEVNYPPPFGAL